MRPWEWVTTQEHRDAMAALRDRGYDPWVQWGVDEGDGAPTLLILVKLDTPSVDIVDEPSRIESPTDTLPTNQTTETTTTEEEEESNTTSTSTSSSSVGKVTQEAAEDENERATPEIPRGLRVRMGNLGVTSADAERWNLSWRIALENMTPSDASASLASYLASCSQRTDRYGRPDPDRWTTWWVEDRRRARGEAVSRQAAESEHYRMPPARTDLDEGATETLGEVRRS